MADDREIRWIDGELPRVVDELERELIAAGEPVYQRGGMLVRPVRRPALDARNFRRAAGVLGLVPLDQTHLVERATAIADFRRYDRRSEAWRATNCPAAVAATYLARRGQWLVPHLRAVISAPTLRPDGSVLQTPGYDEATGILYDPVGVDFGAVEEHPSRRQAEIALEVLLDAVHTLPFAGEADRSVAIALILTALVRRTLPAAPLGAITAPVMGAGKTLLADCIAIIATGQSAPVMVYPATEEEAAKLLLAVLLEGEAVVLVDNVERPLKGDWLCAVLTSEVYGGRILGATQMISVPTHATFLATGNGLVLVGDLRTRALLCRLDPRCERPEERVFAADLRASVLTRRPTLVLAALTVMRGFLAAGVRPGDVVPPWGRFDAWSDLVRAPLVWLGLQDPCASLRALEDDDPERARHLALLRAWHAAFGEAPTTLREAIDLALRSESHGLRDALEAIARDRSGQVDPLRAGKWLRHVAGRICGGLLFVRVGERNGSARWVCRPTAT